MEIKASGTNTAIEPKNTQNQKPAVQTDSNFADELKDLSKKEVADTPENAKVPQTESEKAQNEKDSVSVENQNSSKEKFSDNTVENAIGNLNNLLSTLNQSEDNTHILTKDIQKNPDKLAVGISDISIKKENQEILLQKEIIQPELKTEKFKQTKEENNEGTDVINNDFNIDNKDKLLQMSANMNFGSDGQPFSSFMQNENNNNSAHEPKLSSSAKDLAEEAAILSTMAENIAMANKADVNNEKTIIKEDGIKKIDTKTNMVKEIIVKYDTVVMNESDVQVFADLVEGKGVDIHSLVSENVQKSVHISKTLSDMLARAMEDNKPVRIEFDNGISVIIKISRDGKLSADFLPSTQVAEAYLKENLPLLKQKFSEQNLDYDELNQRERRNPDREQNRKKGRENE